MTNYGESKVAETVTSYLLEAQFGRQIGKSLHNKQLLSAFGGLSLYG
jgi:hypothetical protein